MFNSNSKFKRLNLAEKGTCSEFRLGCNESVREGPMHRFRNIFHSVHIKNSRYAFFLIAQVKMYVQNRFTYFVLAHSELAHYATEGPSRWTPCT